MKSVALTAAGKTIAAKSFDITLDDQSGALNTDGQSETITLSYEAGSEPAAASFKAYFNVPAATYGKLSVVITTEGHTASLDLTTDGIELLPGELAYTTKAVSGWTALAAAPTLEWVDNPILRASGDQGMYECKGQSASSAGIEGFVIKVDSKGLATILGQMQMPVVGTVTTMDMINDPNTEAIKSMIPGFPDPLAGHTEAFQLDLSTLVPLILELPGMGISAEDIYGNHKFTLIMSDALGRSIEKTLVFYVPAPNPTITYAAGAWNDMATFTLQNVPADAQTVKVQYKTTDESQWHDAEVNSDRTAAIARPEFTSHTSADWTTLEAANVKPYKRKVAGHRYSRRKNLSV